MSRKENRSRKVTFRFTENEYRQLERRFQKTTSSQLSHYVRSCLLQKPVVIKYRNESLDALMEELIGLRTELNAIGTNFNQAVRKLHSLKQIPEFREWLQSNEELQAQLHHKTIQIESRIAQLSDKWLQE